MLHRGQSHIRCWWTSTGRQDGKSPNQTAHLRTIPQWGELGETGYISETQWTQRRASPVRNGKQTIEVSSGQRCMRFTIGKSRNRHLSVLDSPLVVPGITGKAQKWRRHDRQGSAGSVGHVDLQTQLLHETESQGTALQRLHVPSHINLDGNTHADRLAHIGRRRFPLLKGQVTVSLAGGHSVDESHSEAKSDPEAPAMWIAMERVGDHSTTLTPQHACEQHGKGGEEGNSPSVPPTTANYHSTAQTQLSRRRVCHATSPWAQRWTSDIEVCTPPSRMPYPSTGRSSPPSHRRSRAQTRAPAPHPPPTRSPTRIGFHSHDMLSLSLH